MLETINRLLSKWMPLITPFSVIAGILFGHLLHPLTPIVPFLFAFMTFVGSLKTNFSAFKHSVTHPFPIILTLVVLHVITPIWAFTLGHLFFSQDPYTLTGMILGVVIPTGVTSMMWVGMYSGNTTLSLTIILIDTLLSPIVVPGSVSILVGQSLTMDVRGIMSGLIFMIVLPTLIGMIINQWFGSRRVKPVNQVLTPISKMTMPIMILVNSSSLAPYVHTINLHIIKIVLSMLFLSISGFIVCWLIAYWTHQQRDNTITLIFTGGMRNISTGVVIAVAYFPPKVALPVVIGMLFQQTLAAVNGGAIRWRLPVKRAVVKSST
ncbi:bile acid:sodium symporter family protein [Sporolactobacillus sp. THM7-4]|nr:bile acid:sodium symporter family protein [Sporolactobacillus sp. THM7-4]